MGRTFHSASSKIQMVKTWHSDKIEGKSLRLVAGELGVDPSQLKRWEKQQLQLEAKIKERNSAARSIHKGRKSQVDHIGEELLRLIFELREQGLSVSIRMVSMKAGELDSAFQHKSKTAKDRCIQRFVKTNQLVHRVHTHESQRSPVEVENEALDFISMMQPIVSGLNRSEDYIINMDQTPIFFSMVPRTTLQSRGSRTVNVRTSTSSTMRVTAAVTITASGKKLCPMLVFKGKPGGRIEREFSGYPDGGKYTVQERAWMDESVMMKWVDTVLKPYVEGAPQGIIPVLLLDSYRCHMMASVVSKINELGVQVEHIPGGCTGLCQPIDVGIGKPLKNHVRNMWEAWMLQQGVNTNIFRPPTRQVVAGWIVAAFQNISIEVTKNSWRHAQYSYFPKSESNAADATINNDETMNATINNDETLNAEFINI